MILTQQFTVHMERVENDRFFLWVEDQEDNPIPAREWKSLLLAFHPGTYYGSFLEESKHKATNGITLSSFQTLTLLANPPTLTISSFTWSEKTEQWMNVARMVYKALLEGRFEPDFETYRAEHTLKWRFDLSMADMLPGKGSMSAAKEWLNMVIAEIIEQHEEVNETWQQIETAFPLTSVHYAFNEEDWWTKIGFRKDDTPFHVGLQLSEPAPFNVPENEDNLWSLDVVLQDKQDVNRRYVWQGNDTIIPSVNHEPEENMPKEWLAWQPKMRQQFQSFQHIVPQLNIPEESSAVSLPLKLNEHEAWQFLTEDSLHLSEAGIPVFLPSWWEAVKDMKPKLKAQLKSSVGSTRQSFVGLGTLVQFNWKLALGDTQLSEEDFRELIAQNRRLVFRNGQWFQLDPEFIQRMKKLLHQVDQTGLTFRDVLEQEMLRSAELPANEDSSEDSNEVQEVLPTAESVQQLMEIELNEHLTTLIEQLRQDEQIPLLDVPATFRGEIRSYQQWGMSWLLFLRRFGLGGCLADEMGLGKTIQYIGYLLTVQKQKTSQKGPSLLICPTSVLGNWQREIKRFAPTLNLYVHYGPNRPQGEDFKQTITKQDIVLTSYNLAQMDEETLTEITWDNICLDEAQNIKNAYTKQASAIRRFQAGHCIALTGTPIENRLTELWSIMQFLNPGYLGSLNAFRKHYVNPIEKEQDPQKIRQVQRLVHPFLLRRTKNDPQVALNLPDKQEQKVFCSLTEEQAALYEQVIQDTLEYLDKEEPLKRRSMVLGLLLKLKQICDHPSLYLKEQKERNEQANQMQKERSHKLMRLYEIVEELRQQGEQCLIFTQFIDMGHMIQSTLEEHFQESALFLHGGTPQAQREQFISAFQKGETNLFILSLKAGGSGLNLTAANHVIHYDRWWNPAVEDQATDRAHRIGQERHVHVHKLITTGTLEERIDTMIERKKTLSDQIMQGEQWMTELSTSELRELITFRRTWMEGS